MILTAVSGLPTMTQNRTERATAGQLAIFNRLVANTGVANVTNNFVWFAVTFWAYLETQSVLATAIIGGTYMLLLAGSALLFGTFVDGHLRKTSMLVSSIGSMVAYAAAAVLYGLASDAALQDVGSPAFWGLVVLILAGAVTGNLRTVALSTTVTLLVPKERHDKANGLVGTVNGIAFALTSVFSGLAIGYLGMGWSLLITIAATALATLHLVSLRVPEARPEHPDGRLPLVDLVGAVRAVRVVPGLVGLLFFTTFNNLLGGAFMALVDPYGLTLVSVQVWGAVLAIMGSGFIVGGLLVASRGLGTSPVRRLLLANLAMWAITFAFPIRSSIVLLTIGFTLYTVLIPMVEAAEQTILQKVVPFAEQGRVFGFAQTVETIASPITSFAIGPVAHFWVIPSMTSGALAASIGPWFGTGPDRGMALLFMASAVIGLVVTALAFRSRAYGRLSGYYCAEPELVPVPAPCG
jgi:DHA3 family multidrug efflux protein-like MFS transporter